MLQMISTSPEATRQIGQRLGALLKPGDLICFKGDLGAGKTTFTQGVATGWGSFDEVSSPTFVLVNVYRRADGDLLYHFDTYRLESAAEAEELDLDAMLTQGPLLIEWADRIREILPAGQLWVTLEHLDDTRRKLSFSASGPRCQQLLQALEPEK